MINFLSFIPCSGPMINKILTFQAKPLLLTPDEEPSLERTNLVYRLGSEPILRCICCLMSISIRSTKLIIGFSNLLKCKGVRLMFNLTPQAAVYNCAMFDILRGILGSIVVSIPACHAGDRGSIPRRRARCHFCLQILSFQ